MSSVAGAWGSFWEMRGLRMARDIAVVARLLLPKPQWLFLLSVSYAFFVLSLLQWRWWMGVTDSHWAVIGAAFLAIVFIAYHLHGLLKAIRCIEPLARMGEALDVIKRFRPALAEPEMALRFETLAGGPADNPVTVEDWCLRRDSLREMFSEPVKGMQTGIVSVWALHSVVIFFQLAAFVGLARLHDPTTFVGATPIGNAVDALYFTAVSVTTIGYGDVRAGNMLGQVTVIAVAALAVVIFTTAIGMVLRTVNEFEHTVEGDLDLSLGAQPE